MPLFDHFHAPLLKRRHWESFHSSWTAFIARQLNKQPLPAGFIAEPTVSLGVAVEADVATLHEDEPFEDEDAETVVAGGWTPPKAPMSVTVDFGGLDVCEVRVYDDERARSLVAAVEVVSPANKDRSSHRRAFVAKCAAYLQQDVSVVIVDVVTHRRKNLYAELVAFLDIGRATHPVLTAPLYAVACRVLRRGKRTRLEAWPASLQVGAALPTLPLWLTRELAVPLDLEASYAFTCDSLRISA